MNLNKILVVLTSVLLVLVGILIFNNYNLSTRVECLNTQIIHFANCDSKTIEDLKYQEFKEDSYIRQQDRDTTLILLIIPVFFAAFGYFTFKLSSDEFAFFKNEMIRNYEEQKTKNESVHKQLVETQIELFNQMASSNINSAVNSLGKQDCSQYLFFTFEALTNYNDYRKNSIILKEQNRVDNVLGN